MGSLLREGEGARPWGAPEREEGVEERERVEEEMEMISELIEACRESTLDSKQATRVCRSCARPEEGSAEAEAIVEGVKIGARGGKKVEGAEEVVAEEILIEEE